MGFVFFLLLLGSLYPALLLLSRGPLNIYSDQARPNVEDYDLLDDRPRTTASFLLKPLLAILVFALALVATPSVAPTLPVFWSQFLAGLAMGQLIFGLINSQEAMRPTGWGPSGLMRRGIWFAREKIATAIQNKFFGVILFVVAIAVRYIPFIGAPCQFVIGNAPPEAGLPWIAILGFCLIFAIRWATCREQLAVMHRKGFVGTGRIVLHWLAAPSFAALLLVANTLFAESAFTLTDFERSPVGAGLGYLASLILH